MFNRLLKAKKAGILLLALMVAFSFSGCGQADDEDGPDSLLDLSSTSEQADDLSSEAEGEEFDAALSYVNSSYIVDTGDESAEMLIRKVKQTLTAEDTTQKSQAEAVLDALKKVPKDLKKAETFVNDDFTINSVKVSGSTLTIDLSSDDMESAGMYDEEFFVYQIVDSMLNTFKDLSQVRFTVDGVAEDSLNYIDISSPFTAKDVDEFLSEDSEDSEDSEKEQGTAAKKADSSEDSDKESEKNSASSSDSDDKEDSSSSDKKNTDSDSSDSSKNDSQTASGSKNSSQNSSSSGSKSSSANNSSSSSSSSGSSSGTSSSGSKNSSSGSSASGSKSSSSNSSGSASGNKKSSSSGTSSSSSSGNSSSSDSSSGTTNDNAQGNGSSSSSGNQSGVVNDEDLE